MKHLLDANTLIEAKNRYYGMKICPGYWSWLVLQNQVFELASIVPVKDELTRGRDELADWAKDNPVLFHDISDAPTQHAFAQLVEAIAPLSAAMKVGALDEFLSGADPWLIAKAMSTGATVVTHEVLNLEVKRKFIIPNICRMFDVPYMNTFELLTSLRAEFVLSA